LPSVFLPSVFLALDKELLCGVPEKNTRQTTWYLTKSRIPVVSLLAYHPTVKTRSTLDVPWWHHRRHSFPESVTFGLSSWLRCKRGFAMGSRSCSPVFELRNVDRWQPLPSDPSELTCGWPAMGS
jgi:hypothetical protein